MKTEIKSAFKATINNVVIENEEYYKALTEIIDYLESKFEIETTEDFVKDLMNAAKEAHAQGHSLKDIKDTFLLDVMQTKDLKELQLTIYGDVLEDVDFNKNIKKNLSLYFFKNYLTEEKEDILLAALVYGVDFKAKYEMTAPYTHGYTVNSSFVKNGYCNAISVGRDWQEQLPKHLLAYLDKSHPYYNYEELINHIIKQKQEIAFGENPLTTRVANGYENNISKEDVLMIIKGGKQGDYSTMTPTNQNYLAMQLTLLRYHELLEGEIVLREDDQAILSRISEILK